MECPHLLIQLTCLGVRNGQSLDNLCTNNYNTLLVLFCFMGNNMDIILQNDDIT